MNDLGDKMTPEEKGRVNSKLDELKKAIEKNDIAAMKSGKSELDKIMQEFGARLYQSAGANPNAGAAGQNQSQSQNDNETVDAEFSDKN